ncbi:MAG: FMN phosphatase YigB (HAD superfamily) [Cryomorphaceae bacterium]|jgi:FMN phosphatase YigB (HAD superfamily)
MTFLFDIGNVLLAFDFLPALNSLKGPAPDPDAIEKIISAKDDFEAGETPLDEYIILVRELLDFHGSEAELFTAWNSIFTEIPETFQLALSLKERGHRLILFSNINPIHAPYCIQTHKLLERFDHAVFSYEIGAVKPYDNFFTRAFEKHQIIPEETIYIDDLPENIAAGKRHGLISFCYDYRKHDNLLSWLETHITQ